MPTFEIVAYVTTSQTVEADTIEEARVHAGLLDEFDLMMEAEYVQLEGVEVFPLD